MSKDRSSVFFSGLMLGATIGAFTSLLMTPRTGRETRKLLKKSANALPEIAEDLSSSVQIQADRISVSALSNWDDTLERLRSAIAAGMDATQRESQELKQNASSESNSPRQQDN